MVSIKILQKTDIDQVLTLMHERPEVFNGYTDDDYKKYLDDHAFDILQNDLFFNVGIYFDTTLAGIFFLKEMTSQPAWCVTHFLFKKNVLHTKNYSYLKDFYEMAKKLDEIIFDEMEINRKLNRFHYAYRASDNTARSLGSASRIISAANRMKEARASKYAFGTDCILKPNTMPKYEYQKQLILNRTWPIEIGFRTGLKIDV